MSATSLSRTFSLRTAALGLALGVLVVGLPGSEAAAQQPARPQAEPQQGGEAPPIRPRQPGTRAPSRNPGIQPGFPPGFDPGGRRPMRPLPAGHPPVGGQPVAAAPAKPMTPRDAHGHCPGHGPHDSLWEHSHINWYQGLLGVDNEKAKSASFVDRLLWRYHNPEDECDAANQEPPVLAALINFAILIGLFVKFGRKPLAEGLAKRKKGIVEDLVAAKSLADEAEERLARYESQLENLEDRRLEIQEEAAYQWEAEKKRILAEAEERRTRMRRDAEVRVEQELKAAQLELFREAIEGAARAAEALVAARLQPSDHDRLADEYLTSVATAIRAGGAGSTSTSTSTPGGAA